eukprot:1221840-Pyramimonas_sp.AAC.1
MRRFEVQRVRHCPRDLQDRAKTAQQTPKMRPTRPKSAPRRPTRPPGQPWTSQRGAPSGELELNFPACRSARSSQDAQDGLQTAEDAAKKPQESLKRLS